TPGPTPTPEPTTPPEPTTTTEPTTTPEPTTAAPVTVMKERLIGDVDLNGSVTINDALEILKYLAKLASALDDQGIGYLNALTMYTNPTDDAVPTINDALQVLKFLAKLESTAGKMLQYYEIETVPYPPDVSDVIDTSDFAETSSVPPEVHS
ncbi:MAG: hypothetical protein FWF82_04805, partial [Oscillospiraceae bacterium]|nr:hypothetical protein [Oscillospiraceae bacterium]